MSESAKRSKGPVDRVERAVASIRAGVGSLVGLLGDEDQGTMERAAMAMDEIGPYVVGPLIAALPGASSPRHRVAIVAALMTFGSQARSPIVRALHGALKREQNPDVEAAIRYALASQISADLGLGPGPQPPG